MYPDNFAHAGVVV